MTDRKLVKYEVMPPFSATPPVFVCAKVEIPTRTRVNTNSALFMIFRLYTVSSSTDIFDDNSDDDDDDDVDVGVDVDEMDSRCLLSSSSDEFMI